MKFKNGVVILEDEANGKAYARQLNGWEQNLVLAQLQALDGGALKVVEIAPIIVRGANVSEARARQIMAERPQTVAEGMAEVMKGGAPVAIKSATGNTVAQSVDEMQYALCYRCGQRTAQHARYGDEDNPDALTYHCKACDAEQCERVRCVNCGKVCTNPQQGAHYCTNSQEKTK